MHLEFLMRNVTSDDLACANTFTAQPCNPKYTGLVDAAKLNRKDDCKDGERAKELLAKTSDSVDVLHKDVI